MVVSFLSSTQRYAAGTLFAIALHQAQIHQKSPLGSSTDAEPTEGERTCAGSSSSDSVAEYSELWVHENSALLRPVFRVFEIESTAWSGMEETACSSQSKHHIEALLRMLAEESGNDASSQGSDQEVALSKAVDAMEENMRTNSEYSKLKEEKNREYVHECREKLSTAESQSNVDANKANEPIGTVQERDNSALGANAASQGPDTEADGKAIEEGKIVSYNRKIILLYELLSACLADKCEDNKKSAQRRKGYDARHRVALRLLATWLDIKWAKMEAIEMVIACSAMAVAKQEESKEEGSPSSESKWAKWRHAGIIGAAAITGGTLMAITGGLAAPAIAAGFSALAPTLGTIIPVIGASGFAAAASAAGTVAGSVAVAASFGAAGAGLAGTKMARRTGDVDEFEFKALEENQSQGRLAVEILVSGLVFKEEDFIRPWEGLNDNAERYAVKWESKHLIAVSTAIQDWLTSRLTTELMRQGAMLTVLGTLVTALAWPAALLSATDYIDSTWAIAIDRTDKAGKLLAEVLLKGYQGNRPVTLVGFSLGARLVFKCLETLAETEHNAEIVERVVLLGAPLAVKDEKWEAARKMVAGRFVNAYSTNDWTLGISYRSSLLTRGLAGIQSVDIPGIENVDVTDLVEGHSSYLWITHKILEQLELEAYYPVFRSAPSPPNNQ